MILELFAGGEMTFTFFLGFLMRDFSMTTFDIYIKNDLRSYQEYTIALVLII